MQTLKIRIKPQTILNITLICYLCWNLIRVLVYRLTGLSEFSYTATYILIYGLLLLYLLWSKRWFTKESMLILGCMLLYLGLTCWSHPEYMSLFFEPSSMWQTNQIITTQVFTFTAGFTILPIICLYKDSDNFVKSMTIAAFINAVFSVYLYMTGNFTYGESTITSGDAYSMSMGYNVLIPLFVLSYNMLKSSGIAKKVMYAIPSVIMLLLVILSGTRGPLLCVIIFAFLYLMFGIDYKFKRVAKFGIALATLILVYLCLYSSLLIDIATFLNNLGISSRSINSILNGMALDDNGRTALQLKAISLISEGGAFGHGFCSSRYFYFGSYPHNIFLEILVDMGYVGGTVFIGLLVIGVIRFFMKVHDYKWRAIFIVLFSCAFGRLFVSGSFWTETFFWEALAVGITAMRCIKQEKVATKMAYVKTHSCSCQSKL